MEQTQKKWGKLKLVFERTGASSQTITFEVIAPKRVTRNGEVAWTICPNGNNDSCTGYVPGPVGVGDPWVRYVLAGGISFCEKSKLDCVSTNNGNMTERCGRKPQSFSAGLALNSLNLNNTFAADLLLSFEFGVERSRVIDGFICGVTLLGFQSRNIKMPQNLFGTIFSYEKRLRPHHQAATQTRME